MASNRRKKSTEDSTPSLTVVEPVDDQVAKTAKSRDTVASVRRSVETLSESVAEIDAKLDKLQAAVERLEASTRVIAVEEDGELSPVSVSALYKDVDVLKTISKMLVDRIKKNNAKVQQITDEADRLKTKYSRWL